MRENTFLRTIFSLTSIFTFISADTIPKGRNSSSAVKPFLHSNPGLTNRPSPINIPRNVSSTFIPTTEKPNDREPSTSPKLRETKSTQRPAGIAKNGTKTPNIGKKVSSEKGKESRKNLRRKHKKRLRRPSSRKKYLRSVMCKLNKENQVMLIKYNYSIALQVRWLRKEGYLKVLTQNMKLVQAVFFYVHRKDQTLRVSLLPAIQSKIPFRCRTYSMFRRKKVGHMHIEQNEVVENKKIVIQCWASLPQHVFNYIKICLPGNRKSCLSEIYKPEKLKGTRSVFLIKAIKDMHGLVPWCCINETHSKLEDRCVNATKEIHINEKVHNLAVFPLKKIYKKNDNVLCTADGYPTPETTWNALHLSTIDREELSDNLRLSAIGSHSYRCVARNAFHGHIYQEEKLFNFTIVESDTAKIEASRQVIAFALCGVLLGCFLLAFLIVYLRKALCGAEKIQTEMKE